MSEASERLKLIRNDLGINQKEIAVRLGFKQSYYSDVENGKRNITSKVIESLQKIFNISSDWVLTGKGAIFLTNSDKNISPKNVPPMYQTKNTMRGIDFVRRLHADLKQDDPVTYELFINIFVMSNFQHFIEEFETEYLTEFWKKSIPFASASNYKKYKSEFLQLLTEYEYLRPALKKLSKAILQFYADFKPFDKEDIIENHFDTSNS